MADTIPTAKRTLDAGHRAELHASGIPDELIERAGIYSAENAEIRELLGWQRKACDWGRGYVIPFLGTDGKPTGYARVKLDHPRGNHKGGIIKYESPRKLPNRGYLPPNCTEALNTLLALLLTEGEKKALKAEAAGFHCIGLVGVWGFQQKRDRNDHGRAYGKRRLIPDLEAFKWKGRDVYIVFDSDAAENRSIRLAESRLAELLKDKGATVRIVRLPKLGDGKTGLDDFLVHHGDQGPAELKKLMADAEEAETPDSLGPMDWARAIIAEEFTGPHGITLAWHRDEFWKWTGRHYVQLETTELASRVLKWLDDRSTNALPRFANDIAKGMQALTVQPFKREPPFWIKKPDDAAPAEHMIAFRNGLLDVSDVGGELRLHEHTPQFFSPASLPYQFDPDATCPEWLRFLDSSLEKDAERISLLQKWFGLLLTADTSLQQFLMLVGPPRCGKGTITKVLEHVIGPANCTSPILSSLGTEFGLWPLLEKRVAIVQDAHLGRGSDSMRIVETLKSIVGEDAQNVNRKYLSILRGVHLKVRFVISANELPALTDASGALIVRLSALPFNVSFVGREDPGLFDRIKPEAPGVLNWSLQGLYLLYAEGMHVPEASRSIIASFHQLTSPILQFIEECCDVGPCRGEPTGNLYDAYCQWAMDNGQKTMSNNLLGTRLRAINTLIERKRRRVGGDREYFYSHIQLNGAGVELLEKRRRRENAQK